MRSQSGSSLTRVVKELFRYGLFLIVLWFVAGQARDQWNAAQNVELSIKPGWLLVAAAVYLVSWFPSIWFWDRLIVKFGQQARLYPLARSYYCGMLGKYVPGKAAVILIRAAMLKPFGVSAVRAGIASMVEAGAVMLVGLIVSLAFAATVIPADAIPDSFPDFVRGRSVSWTRLAGIVAVAVGAIPLLTVPTNRIFAAIARMAAKREARQANQLTDVSISEETAPRLEAGFLIASSLSFSLCWAGQGLSLQIVLHSLGADVFSIESWTVCTVAASAGTAIGFFALFAPGGLAVREGLIIAVLEPSVGGAMAVAGAVLLRLTSFTAECLTAVGLYMTVPNRDSNSEPEQ